MRGSGVARARRASSVHDRQNVADITGRRVKSEPLQGQTVPMLEPTGGEDLGPYAGIPTGETMTAQCNPNLGRELLMADNDLGARFDEILLAAGEANHKIHAAGQQAREQIHDEAACAQDRASHAAGQLKDRAEEGHGKASKHWRDLADKWEDHVEKIRKDVRKKKADHDADAMAAYAEMTEGYALESIEFAQAAIYEAEYAVFEALSARAAAEAMAS